jgi:hypothetical protein
MRPTAHADTEWNKHAHGRAPEYGATPQTETATEARQGVTGHNVRYVLFFGIAGVVVAFALIFAVFFA